MTERIDSEDVVKPNSVEVREPTPLEIWLENIPRLLTYVAAIGSAIAVVTVCILILFTKDPDVGQFRQEAFTALISILTGAFGFLFGVSQKNTG